MAYTADSLIVAPTGLTLLGSYVYVSGGTLTLDATFRNVSNVWREIGTSGVYLFDSAAVPDSARGVILAHTGSVSALSSLTTANTYGGWSVNPGEVERPEKALPDAAPQTSGGIITSGTGTAQLTTTSGNVALTAAAYGNVARIVHGHKAVRFVSKSGNDSNDGLSPTSALLTLGAAKTAASAGDLVVVLDGTYNERDLLKNGVDWHFSPGSAVAYTGTAAGSVFDDSDFGANTAVVCRITGEGQFSHTGTPPLEDGAPVNAVFNLTQPGTFVDVQFRSIDGSATRGPNNVGIYIDGGDGRFNGSRFVRSDTYDAVLIEGAQYGGGRLYLDVPRVAATSNGDNAIEGTPTLDGFASIKADEIDRHDTTAYAINSAGNSTGHGLVVRADKITGGIRAGQSVQIRDAVVLGDSTLSGQSGATITVEGECVLDGVTATTATSSRAAMYIASGSPIVRHSLLDSHSSAASGILGTATVRVLGAVSTNVAPAGTITMSQGSVFGALAPATAGRSLAVDASGRVDLGQWLGTAPLALSAQKVQAEATASVDGASIRTAIGMASANLDTQLAAIDAQTDLITTNSVTVIAPYANGSLTIRKGDSYGTTSGQTLTVSKPSGASWPSISTGSWTVTLEADVASDNTASGTATLSVACVVVSDTSVRIDLTSTQTSGLALGLWDWSLRATKTGSLANTLISGRMRVLPNLAT